MASGKADQDAHGELTALPPRASTTRPKSLHEDDHSTRGAPLPVPNTNPFGSSYPGLDHLVLVQRRRRWALAEGWRLENNLIFGVGLLELANAGDFAANVWNTVPVPIYAVVFMAIGGTAAGVICVFAFLDALRAWHNIKFLRRQRLELAAAKARQADEEQRQQHISRSSLEVIDKLTRRELRTELLSRWAMDILMGGGAVMISIGTFLAIGGANHAVYVASNILSGYLGNAPLALFGLVNSTWQVMIWMIMQSHKKAAIKAMPQHPATSLIRRRCFDVQLFSIVNSITTIMGGVGSMLTPTFWWGYVVLIPVIVSSFFCNIWWRKKVGYDRPDLNSSTIISTEGLIEELSVAGKIEQIIQDHSGSALQHLVPEREKPDGLLDFLTTHGLFELFCLKLVNDENFSARFVGSKGAQLNLDEESVSALYHSHSASFWKVAEKLLRVEGGRHFRHRIRFFTELLGEHLSHTHS